mgnify:CR=1 FL=1
MQRTKSNIKKTFIYQFETSFLIEQESDSVRFYFSDKDYLSETNKFLSNLVKNNVEIIYFNSQPSIVPSLYFDEKIDYKYLPLESVCLYVPGSTASYPSTVLMNAIPAIVAKVKRIVMINPGYKGKQNPAVLYAAKLCGITEIYSIGGPSAIAAVAYGTKTIKPVNKIVGPGNEYVAAAKKEVFGDVGVEAMSCGPSEVMIVCDKNSNPEWLASDLVGQAEHSDPVSYTHLTLPTNREV